MDTVARLVRSRSSPLEMTPMIRPRMAIPTMRHTQKMPVNSQPGPQHARFPEESVLLRPDATGGISYSPLIAHLV
jgi:hypothetical protein